MFELLIAIPMILIVAAVAWGAAGIIVYTLYHLARYKTLPRFSERTF